MMSEQNPGEKVLSAKEQTLAENLSSDITAAPAQPASPLSEPAESAPTFRIVYPADLPVSARKTEIAQAIAHHQVVVVSGETGSGKTTQLPKICLELGRGKGKLIGHTQPRRIAARSVAERIAQEMHTKLGEIVGYQVRFYEEISVTTRIKLMTDGILLAEIRRDPRLEKYDTIIIDEAHERSLNIDFLLGYLSRLLPQRPDLKVIITSATIDAQGFVDHFQNRLQAEVPSIEVSGRSYPVEIRYRPLTTSLVQDRSLGQAATSKNSAASANSAALDNSPGSEDRAGSEECAVLEAAAALKNSADSEEPVSAETTITLSEPEGICLAVEELLSEEPGDILVFLAGEADIRETESALSEYLLRNKHLSGGAIEILPLYARLSPAEQQRIFSPHQHCRIILATNVAETSLTVPGIKYVIDPGLARISRYSNRTKIQRLPIEEISQASAKQRAGRCGRTAPGIVIRLYSEENYLARPPYTDPEILRTSLASVILSMEVLGLGAVKDFPFLDSPDPKAVRDGEQLLWELGALKPRHSSKLSAGSSKSNHANSVAPQTSSANSQTSSANPQASPLNHYTGSGKTSANSANNNGSGKSSHAEATTSAIPDAGDSDTYTGKAPFDRPFTLTKLGYQLAKFPIDPRLARMIIAGDKLGCAGEILVIVAALGMQDVRLRPLESQQEADQLHRRFLYPGSDFLSYLNLWRYIRSASQGLSHSAFRKLCKREFLHYLRCREWQDLVAQLRQVAKETGIKVHPLSHPNWHNPGLKTAFSPAPQAASTQNSARLSRRNEALATAVSSKQASPSASSASAPAFASLEAPELLPQQQVSVACLELTKASSGEQIHQALLTGLFSQVANWSESKKTYLGPRGSSFTIWPGSALAGKEYDWIMCGELVETSRVFARNCARVKAEWIERSAQRVLKYHYGEITWSDSRLQALVEEKVTLYALSLRAGQLVPLASLGEKLFSPPAALMLPARGNWASPPALAGATSSRETDTRLSAKEIARNLFIRYVLVRGKDYPFQKRNLQALQQAHEIEERRREHGLVADEDQLVAWMATRVGKEVTNQHSFWRWFKQADNPRILDYPLEVILNPDSSRQADSPAHSQPLSYSSGAKFDTKIGTQLKSLSAQLNELTKAGLPDYWHGEGLKLPLSYCFAPGSKRDGVSLDLSQRFFQKNLLPDHSAAAATGFSPQISGLQLLTAEKFDWLVPGFLNELLAALLRGLPKSARRELGPLPQAKEKIWAFFQEVLRDPEKLSTATVSSPQNADTKQAQELAASLQRLAAWNNGAKSLAEVEQSTRKPKPSSPSETSPKDPRVQKQSSPAPDQPTPSRPLPLVNPDLDFYQVLQQALNQHGLKLTVPAYQQLRASLPPHLQMQFTCQDLAVIQLFLRENHSEKAVKATGGKNSAGAKLAKAQAKAKSAAPAKTPPASPVIELIKINGKKTLWTRDFTALKSLIIRAASRPGRSVSQSVQPVSRSGRSVSQSVQSASRSTQPVSVPGPSSASGKSAASLRGTNNASPSTLANSATPLQGAAPQDLQAIPRRLPRPWGLTPLAFNLNDVPGATLESTGTALEPHGAGTESKNTSPVLTPALRADWKRITSYYALAEQVSARLSLAPQRITSRWSHQLKLALAHTPYQSHAALIADLELVTVLRCFKEQATLLQEECNQLFALGVSAAAFQKLAAALRQKLRNDYEDALFETVKLAALIMQEKQQLDKATGGNISLELLPLVQELRTHPYQRSRLLYDYWEYLEHLPRFLKARRLGLEKALASSSGKAKVEKGIREMQQAQSLLEYKAEELGKIPALSLPLADMKKYLHACFLQEELLVSLLAQELKTSEKVSLIRMKKHLQH